MHFHCKERNPPPDTLNQASLKSPFPALTYTEKILASYISKTE